MLSIKTQKELKRGILKEGKGRAYLSPEVLENGEVLFFIKDTCIAFFIDNWEEFITRDFKDEVVNFDLVHISPPAVTKENSPFLGVATICEMRKANKKITDRIPPNYN